MVRRHERAAASGTPRRRHRCWTTSARAPRALRAAAAACQRPAEEDRERRSQSRGIYDRLLGEAPVVVKLEETGADIQREQLGQGLAPGRMANATEWRSSAGSSGSPSASRR